MMQKHAVVRCTLDSLDKTNLTKFRKMIKEVKVNYWNDNDLHTLESGNELLDLMEINDDVLLRFIRRPQVNLQESLTILMNIIELRFSHPYIDIAEKGYPSAVRHVFDKGILGVVQQRDKLGRKVIWCKLSRWNPDKVSEHDMVRAIVILGWELLSSKVTQLKGIVGILDVSGCSSTHFKLLTPSSMQIYLQLFLRCNPFHIGGLHVVFAPAIFNVVLSALKTFLPKKYSKLIHIHKKKERLVEYIPANILPNFLCGVLTEKDAIDNVIVEYLLQKDKYYKRLLLMGKEEFFRIHPELRALNFKLL